MSAAIWAEELGTKLVLTSEFSSWSNSRMTHRKSADPVMAKTCLLCSWLQAPIGHPPLALCVRAGVKTADGLIEAHNDAVGGGCIPRCSLEVVDQAPTGLVSAGKNWSAMSGFAVPPS